MIENPHIRIASPADLEPLLPLIVDWRNMMQRSYPDEETLRSSIEGMIASSDTEFFLATDDDGKRLGFIQQRCRFSLWLNAPEATLEDLFVETDSRQMGVGARLVQFAISRAEEKGCKSIKLDTNDRNQEAIRLYKRLGFVSNSTRFPDSHQLSFEKGLNPK